MALLEPSAVTEGAAAPMYRASALLEAAILQQGCSRAACLSWGSVGQNLSKLLIRMCWSQANARRTRAAETRLLPFVRSHKALLSAEGQGRWLRMVSWGWQGGRKTPGFPIWSQGLLRQSSEVVYSCFLQYVPVVAGLGALQAQNGQY